MDHVPHTGLRVYCCSSPETRPSYHGHRVSSRRTRWAPGWWWYGSLGWRSFGDCCRLRRPGEPSGGVGPPPSPLLSWCGRKSPTSSLHGACSASWRPTVTVDPTECVIKTQSYFEHHIDANLAGSKTIVSQFLFLPENALRAYENTRLCWAFVCEWG